MLREVNFSLDVSLADSVGIVELAEVEIEVVFGESFRDETGGKGMFSHECVAGNLLVHSGLENVPALVDPLVQES